MDNPHQLPPGPQPDEIIVRNHGAQLPAAEYVEMPAAGYMPADQGGGLMEYGRILRRSKGTLALIALLGAVTGISVALLQTPVYQARAALEIQDLNENFLDLKLVSPVSETGTAPGQSDIQTQIKILQEESLLERVVAKLGAQKAAKAAKKGSRIAAWREALGLPSPPPATAQESALAAAKGGLRVSVAGQTRIVEILYDSTDPKYAADFANTLAVEFIDQNVEARWKMTQHTGEWLSRQLDEMRIKLERSDESLQSYARRTGLMFTSDKNNIAEEKLRQLQEALSKAQADRVSKQSRYEMANSSAPEALPDVLNDSSLRDYQVKLTDLNRQRAELGTTYKADYSKMKSVQAQIASLETALKSERAAIINRIKNEYDEGMRREKLLTTDYANQSRLVSEQAEKAIQYNILKREVDSNRQIYEAMLQKVKEASVASAMRASNVRVVNPAKPPRLPYKPSLPMNAALGLVSGVFLGVMLVIVRERADCSIQAPGDAPSYLNVPELGVIPSAAAARSRQFRSYYRDGRRLTGPKAEGTEAKDAAHGRVELVTWQRKPSVVAEAFRATLDSILFCGENGNRPRVIAITSANPQEGKTTVASNLALALAEINRRVLLIDGDLRKPRLHEIFGVSNERGLSDLLGEGNPLNGGGVHVTETRYAQLFLLPAGSGEGSFSNLLHSARMPELLKRMRKEFDMVVIDTPPMLHIPDARVLGRMADAVVLVVRSGETTRDMALAATQRLSEDGTRLLGTVLNSWDPRKAGGGYGYRYYAR